MDRQKNSMRTALHAFPYAPPALMRLAGVFFLQFTSLAFAQEQIPPPVVHPPHPANHQVIDFADYKITDGQVNSDWETMLLALSACRETHAAALNIPHGTYTFDDPKILTHNSGGHIQLVGLTDLTINGNGSLFIFHYLRDGCDFTNCQRVRLTNFTVQWDFDIAAPGVVQTLHGQKVIAVNPAYPISAQTPVGAVTEYDTAHLRWRMVEKEVYNPTGVTLVAPQTLSSPDFNLFPTGDTVAVRMYVYSVVGFQFSFNNNADLTFDHLTAENCPGMVYLGYGCDRGFAWNACVIQRRNPTHDLVSTGADGIHLTSTHGDAIIQNCNFSYLGDDSLNLCSVWMTVEARLNNRQATILTTVADPNYVEVGDEFAFLNQANLAPLGTAHVSNISFDSTSDLYTLTFLEPLPAALPSGTVVANLARSSDRALIATNYFHDHRARGMLVQAHDVSITNNRIRNVMGGAIQLTADIADWHEGYGCADVAVTGNLCEGCNDGLWGGFDNLPGVCLGVINIFCQIPAGLDTYPVHQDITLSGNTITNTPNLSFFIGSAENVTLTDNLIQDCPPTATTGIYVSRASAVTITGNQAVHCSLWPGHGIYVDPTTSSSVTQTGNTGF